MKVKTQEPEGFAEFWAEWMPVCRDSDGRPKARDAYAKHILRGASPEDILFAARWHIHDRRQKNTLPYIQLAASWLNAERYEFEADRWRTYQAHLAARASPRDNVVSINVPKSKFLQEWEARKAGA